MTNKSIPSYQFAPENTSGIAREWSGIASALPRKLFALLFCLLFVGVGNVWGTDTNTPTSGSQYRFKARYSGTDYYLVAPTSTGLGTATTTETDGTVFTFTYESSKWYITFTKNATTYWLSGNGTKGNVTISTTKTECTTVTTNGDYCKIGSTKWIQFNYNNGSPRFGCYSSSQTGAKLTTVAVPRTVSWSVNGNSYTTGNPSTSVNSGSKVTTLPTAPGSALCDGSKVFVGWSATVIVGTTNTRPADLFTTAAGAPTVTTDVTYYAVFATAGTPAAATLTATYASHTGWTETDCCGSSFWVLCTGASLTSPVIDDLSTVTSINLKVRTYGGASYNTVTVKTNNNESVGSASHNTTTLTDKTISVSGLTGSGSLVFTGSATTASYGPGMNNITINYTRTPYSNYCTTCCTALGSINGSISWSGGNATVSWDKLSGVRASTPYEVSVEPSAGVTVNSIDLTGANATCSVTGLTAGTAYTFTINAYGDATHCDKDQEIASTAPQITVKSAPVALTGSDYAEGVSGGGTVKTFTVSGVGLTGALTFTAPTNFQVSTDNGSTWSTSGGSKTLAASGTLAETTIKARLVEGLSVGTYGGATTYITISGGGAAAVNSSVSITGTVSSACSVPAIGNPTLTSITGTTITVSCPTISGGTNCDVDEYGFIWKAGSAPTMASYDGKKKTGENNQSTAYNDGLSIDVANNTGTTYYIKAYAHNSAGNNVSATALQVTPRSVTFNSNGGSAVATKYVNSGTKVTAPDAPTKTGYNFGEWQLNSSTFDFANTNVSENITLVATWNPASYDVTLKANGGSSVDQVVSATYTQAMPTTVKAGTDIVAPTYNGYTFAGYYDVSAASGGNQYYTSALASARNWDKTSATNLYGRWTANQYTVTLDANGGVDGATTSVNTTFGQAMPTIAAANLPTREGYRFDGFYTEKSGGTQYYYANGTSAKNQARYSANQKLYAHWVAQLKFSVNGAIDGTLTRDDNTAMPSTATVPASCGDCWSFMGWSTDDEEDEAAEYAGGATHEFGEPTTLYAVFGKTEYKLISDLSDLEANEYYVLSSLNSNEYAMSNTTTDTYYATSVDITSVLKENADGWYLYNPPVSVIWKFTGTTSSGRLYNEAASKYLDLSSNSATILQSSTSDYLKFTKFDSELFNIASTTQTSYFLYMYSGNKWSVDDDHDGFSSCYIYKRQSAEYATEPGCETYDIVWKVDGTPLASGSQTEETTTCTGIETLPTSPDNDELDCANVFMGWSEKELVGAGHDEPDDLFLTIGYAPKIDEDKTFHAVFATAAPITNKYVLGTVDDLKDGQKVILVNHANSVACTSTAGATTGTLTKVDISSSFSNDTLVTSESSIVWTVTKSGDYYVFKSGDNYLYCSGESSLFCGATSDKWTISSGSVDGTYYLTSYNQSSYKFEYYSKNSNFTTYGGTGTAYNTDFYVPALSYSDYQTICCDNSITIGSPSITGSGTVTFTLGGEDISAGDEVETCTSAKDVVATVTPAAGYNCTAVSFSGGSVSVDPTPGAGNYPSAPSSQNYTLSFAKETTAATLSTSATFTAKALTAWAWKYKKDADAADGSVAPYDIPDVVDLYIGQYARFIITGYSPSDVIADKQGFVYVSSDDPAVMQPVLDKAKIAYVSKDANNTYYQVKGKAATESTTITIKATGDGSITKTVTIRVKALPTVTFEDLIHNKTDFANSGDGWTAGTGVLSSTASNVGVVSHTKKTPTHADVAAPGTGNDCEKGHLHLMGWIRSDYPALVAYMNGTGARPEYSAIISAGDDDSDKAYFLAPNASINVEDFNGKTFYAVWATIE